MSLPVSRGSEIFLATGAVELEMLLLFIKTGAVGFGRRIGLDQESSDTPQAEEEEEEEGGKEASRVRFFESGFVSALILM